MNLTDEQIYWAAREAAGVAYPVFQQEEWPLPPLFIRPSETDIAAAIASDLRSMREQSATAFWAGRFIYTYDGVELTVGLALSCVTTGEEQNETRNQD